MTKTREENSTLQTQNGVKDQKEKKKKDAKLGPLQKTIIKAAFSQKKKHKTDRRRQTPTDSTPKSNTDSEGSPGDSVGDATVSPQITPSEQGNSSQIETTTGCSKISSTPTLTSSGTRVQLMEAGVTVDVKLDYGDYVLKMEKRSILSSSSENKTEEAKKLAHNVDKLFLQAEMLRDMGEYLLAKYQESLQLQSRFAESIRKLEFDSTH